MFMVRSTLMTVYSIDDYSAMPDRCILPGVSHYSPYGVKYSAM